MPRTRSKQTEKPHNAAISVFSDPREIPFFKLPTQLDHMIMAVCGEGEVSVTVDVTQRRLGRHKVMVLRPGHIIAACRTSRDFKGFFITASADRLNELLPSIQYVIPYSILYSGDPVIALTDDEYQSLTLIHDLFARQLRSPSRPFGQMALDSLCEHLFYTTLGIYALRTRDIGHRSRREEILSKFIDILEKHFRTERSVNFYAEQLFLTPKHLSTVVKEMSGQTAGEWIDRRVILEAKLMLRTSGMNIQEISSALNFCNQSFFGKYFKHHAGISPREYRTNLSNL